MKELVKIIRREIDQAGVIPFARFMELALYCPEFGYYERLKHTVGRQGDFYTSLSVGALFGELLAFQFAHWIGASGADECRLVEAGAHDGRLGADILNWLKSNQPEVFKETEYWILEPSRQRQEWQRQTLAGFGERVRWFDSWQRFPKKGVRGVIFSNELLDAMPVHRLGWDAAGKSWFEWGVGLQGERLVWRKLERPAHAQSHSPQLPPDLSAVVPDGFTTEICPAAVHWWSQAACALKHGRLLTFDYGLVEGDFLAPERAHGTLRAYYRHRISDDLLGNVGDQDLSAHVNFSAVRGAGESAGLKTEGLLTQAQFLTRIAEATWQAKSGFSDWTPQRVRQFQTLTHPEHLGTKFKVLVQSR